MLRYEVTLSTDPSLAERLEAYMRGTHVPEILATGCFADVRFERAEDADGVSFRTVYHAERREELERYLGEHTAAFRADFLAHFPSGVVASRSVWVEIETWVRSGE